jgi:CRP/FNR family transcriptional regulator, cyclic AMP receptor protein
VRPADEPLPLTIEVRPGRAIVRQGEPNPGAWLVQSGALLMETVDAEGRRFGLDVLGRGDLVGGLTDWIAEATIRSLSTSWLVPAGPAALRDGLARRARRAVWVASSLAWDRIADRVAARLEDLADRFGRPVPGGICIRLPLRQEDIAWLTGSTRESVNRALVELAASGRVDRGHGRYVIRPGPVEPASPRPGASPANTNRSSARAP